MFISVSRLIPGTLFVFILCHVRLLTSGAVFFSAVNSLLHTDIPVHPWLCQNLFAENNRLHLILF